MTHRTSTLPHRIGPAAAVFAALALLLQAYLTISAAIVNGAGAFAGLVEYLGYFTILTNMFAALIFAAHGLAFNAPGVWRFLRRPQNLTAAAASIMVVWSVYHFVLRKPGGLQGAQFWADLALHYIVPFFTVVFWWLTVPRRGISLMPASWPTLMWYPLFYLAYVFVRGAILNSYPYFFIDVTTIGYPRALLNAAGVMLLLIVLILFFWLINRLVGRRIQPG